MCNERCDIMSWGDVIVACDSQLPFNCLGCRHAIQFFSLLGITAFPLVDDVSYPKNDNQSFQADVHFSDDSVVRHYVIKRGKFSLLNPKLD